MLIDLLSGLFDLLQLLIGAVFTLTYMPAASMYPLMTMKYFQGTVSQAGLIEAIYSTAICGMVAVLMPITRQYDIRLHQKLAKLTEQPDK
ncbi:hypothetical protein BTJ08_01630 [Lactobacillus delbrueckii subsp. bulgaricus]|nr:hypothetical protein [Lactobacillus delbrueckii subsp. bulgaricus]MBT8810436.1 hypothetical protein [Lactobacillus delbrueckii subsp. bulgaricus]MBT8827828.1 hypothetical protein [Lactobacillus delbrueckii subsp. bulgaricus]MBT9035322.1 hypothetical protein [Lactobacillus delbrueckii subsp. bulgaricus]MBT9047971.1 hypothetical protein [Lactobacillus delbrueckii subsp. bulgaricus]